MRPKVDIVQQRGVGYLIAKAVWHGSEVEANEAFAMRVVESASTTRSVAASDMARAKDRVAIRSIISSMGDNGAKGQTRSRQCPPDSHRGLHRGPCGDGR